MLLVAALLKAADPQLFIEEIQGYHVFPTAASFGAYFFLVVEVVIGLALVLHVAPRPAIAAFAGLMLFFIGITGYAWSQGHAGGCGCFGRLASRPPGEVMLEDGAYVLLAAFAFWRARSWVSSSRPRWAAFAVALPVFLTAPWSMPRLPIDSLITGIRPGTSLENLAADDLKEPLTQGLVFVAFLGKDCKPCDQALPLMNTLAQTEGAPRVNGIFSGDRREKRAWALEHVPSFPLAHASTKSLRQYYRRLPVFVLLQDGSVRRIWWSRPPTAEEVMAAGGGEVAG